MRYENAASEVAVSMDWDKAQQEPVSISELPEKLKQI